MGVKDLVGAYEARSSQDSPSPRAPSRRTTANSIALSPIGARFLHHPVALEQYQDPFRSTTSTPQRADTIYSTTDTTLHDYEPNDSTVDITDHAQDTQKREFDTKYYSKTHLDDEEEEEKTLLHDSSSSTEDGKYPAKYHSQSREPSPRHRHTRHSPFPHNPIPAKTVFARNAPPLSLPKLDNYLASLPPPHFHTQTTKNGKEKASMFPPMDRLGGRKLEDLEHNSVVLPWYDRKTVFSGLSSLIIGVTGSSAVAMYYSLQGLMNTLQIFALILTTILPLGDGQSWSRWRQLFLGTIPKVLALNFSFTLIQSLTLLVVFLAITGVLLFLFIRYTSNCHRYNTVEGLQSLPQKNQWSLVIITFLLTSLYLPLSTLAIHVLVWSDDLWVVPNPYSTANTTTTMVGGMGGKPVLQPLGPANEFRDPLDFCWTTTMKRNEVNFAPVFVVISACAFIALTMLFPIALGRVIRRSIPKVDQFTELGRPRSSQDMDGEYMRLLDRDRNPFTFLYKGLSRTWPSYTAFYLFAKFSALFIVAVIDPNNCLFRTYANRNTIILTRQILLFVSTIVFFVTQCVVAPFLNPVGNASEWVSRLNYVLTAGIALLVALPGVGGKEALNGWVLYVIYIMTYGLSIYFTLIDTGMGRRFVKWATRRIDFSIDIFSPKLDLASHVKRRIWQESITTLLLTSQGCAIPKEQKMIYSEARDSEYPPYLLNFQATPGERHVENLKILREVGALTYKRAVRLTSGPDFCLYKELADEIQMHHVGPDSYWKAPDGGNTPGCTKFFGNAWWIPFPPTLVIRYDDGHSAYLRHISEFREYVKQNSSSDIAQRRHVRMALRALEGRVVAWPYEHVEKIGSHFSWCCCGPRYSAQSVYPFQAATLRIQRHGHMTWNDLHLGSGFDIQLEYSKKVTVSGEVIGLNEDYDLTPTLARFLHLNRVLIEHHMHHVETVMYSYRKHMHQEFAKKMSVLSYRFLDNVYEQPRDPTGLAESTIKGEDDLRVRRLMVDSGDVLELAYERMNEVSRSEARAWWYIFWDDVWRRNHSSISGLELHAPDFDPHYPSSIAYTPLPRAALEQFLVQRGVMSKTPKRRDFLHHGFLNKLYIRLNDCVFDGRSSKVVWFHMGDAESGLDMDGVDSLAQRQRQRTGPPGSQLLNSILGTGGGTDHDADSINPRQTYLWEGLLNDSVLVGHKNPRPHPLANLGAWFGVTPLVRATTPTKGVSLDVRLVVDRGGKRKRFVLIDEEEYVHQVQLWDHGERWDDITPGRGGGS